MMYTDFSLLALRNRTEASKFYVSAWYLPHDDVNNPLIVEGFFDECEENEARAFVKNYSNPPEMAMLCTIEEYDGVRAETYRMVKSRVTNNLAHVASDEDYATRARLSKDRFYLEKVEEELAQFNKPLYEELTK